MASHLLSLSLSVAPYAEPHVETSLPLILPGGNAPAPRPAPQPPAPVPSEAELRERLAETITGRNLADARAARAQAAADRAQRHRDATANSLRAFAGVDEAAAEETIRQLRGTPKRPA